MIHADRMRRLRSAVMTALTALCTLLAVGALLIILGYIAWQGIGSLNLRFLTDVPRGRSLAGIIVGLVAVQFALAVVSFGIPALGVLHGINGLAIAGVAGAAARRSTESAAQQTAHV